MTFIPPCSFGFHTIDHTLPSPPAPCPILDTLTLKCVQLTMPLWPDSHIRHTTRFQLRGAVFVTTRRAATRQLNQRGCWLSAWTGWEVAL